MTPFMALECYKSFIEKLVAEKNYLLKQAPQNTTHVLNTISPLPEPKMVLPRVGIGSLPHSNFDPYNTGEIMFQAPYAIVGMGEYSDDYNDASMPILIQVCCYSEVDYEEKANLQMPDNLAYLDVINFLTFLKYNLMQQRMFGGGAHRTEMLKPLKMATYADRQYTYPFAFGYLLFDTTMPSIETSGIL